MPKTKKTTPKTKRKSGPSRRRGRQAQGPWTDLALHTLGWKSFQDLCAQVCEVIFDVPVEVYREAQDGGQDATFVWRRKGKKSKQRNVTVQCKFSSKSDRTLKPGDIAEEEDNIVALRSTGEAETYILMTNMMVSAPVAVAIKRRLRELGVVHAHVFGREFLSRVIRSSAKLRALVPRVYGLGDLSQILDERKAEQTRALLGHMFPTLKVYVPTAPHRDAVHSISNHKIVLLLGDRATGKSTIAAILATIAVENPNSRCFKADGPEELMDNWNPSEPGGFYWIDDAFGPNQMREDFVDRWISIMPKVQAATQLLRLVSRLKDEFLDQFPSLPEQVAAEADLGIEPEDNFDHLVSALRKVGPLLEDDETSKEAIEQAEMSIEDAIGDVKSRKESTEDDSDYEWDWHDKTIKQEITKPAASLNSRSIFSDVDE